MIKFPLICLKFPWNKGIYKWYREINKNLFSIYFWKQISMSSYTIWKSANSAAHIEQIL